MARLTLGQIAALQFGYLLAAVLFDWGVYGTQLGIVQIAGIPLMGLAIWTN